MKNSIYNQSDSLTQDEEYELKVHDKLPNELYHYCSFETFIKIISSNTWRFGNINGTNDLSENRNLYLKYLLSEKCFAEKLADKNIRKQLIKNINEQNRIGCNDFYIACFTSKKDSLVHWNSKYGDYGKGICIGIRPKVFTKWQYKYNVNTACLGWTKINYCIYEQIKEMKDILEKEQKYYQQNYGQEADEDYIFDSAANLKDYSLTIKHPEFEIEKEWRLVYSNVTGEPIVDDNFKKQEFDANCSVNKNGIGITESGRFYIEYDLKPFQKFISSINIGAVSEKTIFDVEQILDYYNADLKNNKIEIKKSKIPFKFDY